MNVQQYEQEKIRRINKKIEETRKSCELYQVPEKTIQEHNNALRKALNKYGHLVCRSIYKNVKRAGGKLNGREAANSIRKTFKQAHYFLNYYIEYSGNSDYPHRVITGPTKSNKMEIQCYRTIDGRKYQHGDMYLSVEFGNDMGQTMTVFINGDSSVAFVRTPYLTQGATEQNMALQIDRSFTENLHFFNDVFSQHKAIAQKIEALHNAKRNIENLKSLLKRTEGMLAEWKTIVLPEKTKVELMRQADLLMEGIMTPSAMLLKGPPGTGKTLLADTLSRVCGAKFLKFSLSELKSPNPGQSTGLVSGMWKKARSMSPAVLFIDECESVFAERSANNGDWCSHDIVQAMLASWDGKESGVWVVGATNQRDRIDPAILSRFGSEIEIGLPDMQARKQILERELRVLNVNIDISEKAAEMSQGMSGRDLSMLAKKIVLSVHPAVPQEEDILNATKELRRENNVQTLVDATWETLVLPDAIMLKLQTTCRILSNIEGWKAKGVELPKGLLLEGPPGTGKTQIARTLANESGLPFLAATTADLKASFIGQSGQKVKDLFNRARGNAPCILFLDEIDLVAGSRDGNNTDSFQNDIVGQLLQEMDGIKANAGHVFILAATNRRAVIDNAVLSRLEEKLEIPAPNELARKRILLTLLKTKTICFELEECCNEMAKKSDGLTGRDLKSWVSRAEQSAAQRAVGAGGPENFCIELDDFKKTAEMTNP